MHLYLHIPFCKQACHYCDFHFSTNLSYKESLIKSIVKEIDLQKNYLKNRKLQTIYFGGGSPSILSFNELEMIFEAISKIYDLSEIKEITLEANPDDISDENLRFWYGLGVNRLSLGIQTFNETYLKFMNRAHSSKEAIFALDKILNQGFETSSVDLIYSKTGLHLDEKRQAEILLKDIEILKGFDLKHISAYNLTIEKDTVFGKWAEKDKIVAIPEDYAADQYKLITESLTNLGYEQYEISNFAKDKKYAIHNTSYWLGEEYLGLGPSAHSFNGDSRQWNIASNHKYMSAIEKNELDFEREELTIPEKVNDYLLTGLRTIWGVSLNKISQISTDIPAEFWDTLNDLENNNLIVKNQDKIIIPSSSRILSDRIASDLFWE